MGRITCAAAGRPIALGYAALEVTMPFGRFGATALASVNRYLSAISEAQRNGSISTEAGHVLLYPSLLLATDAGSHYTFELIGARRYNRRLLQKTQKVPSLDVSLGQFSFDGPFDSGAKLSWSPQDQGADGPLIKNVLFSCEASEAAFDARFPGLRQLFPTVLQRVARQSQCFKAIDVQNLTGTVKIENCILTNALDPVVRARYINLLVAVPKSTSEADFRALMKRLFVLEEGEEPVGVRAVREGDGESACVAGQFMNLLLQGAQETTLTKLLEQHSEVLLRAFDAVSISYQPSLPWLTGNPDSQEKYIQPDMIVRDRDGGWRIVEFKLPLLKKSSVTKGEHRRRRFIDSVAEGISQLYNYCDYFDYAENVTAAESRLGGKVINPRLTLIAGTSENVDMDEVTQALRPYKPVDILDYDTLISLYYSRRY